MDKEKNDYTGELITPYTTFMFLLDEALKRELASPDMKQHFYVKKIIYSSHKVPGEGEHKIMSYIRKHRRECASYIGSHVIYGNDSDLILLGLCTKLESVYICNDSVRLVTGAKLIGARFTGGKMIQNAKQNA